MSPTAPKQSHHRASSTESKHSAGGSTTMEATNLTTPATGALPKVSKRNARRAHLKAMRKGLNEQASKRKAKTPEDHPDTGANAVPVGERIPARKSEQRRLALEKKREEQLFTMMEGVSLTSTPEAEVKDPVMASVKAEESDEDGGWSYQPQGQYADFLTGPVRCDISAAERRAVNNILVYGIKDPIERCKNAEIVVNDLFRHLNSRDRERAIMRELAKKEMARMNREKRRMKQKRKAAKRAIQETTIALENWTVGG